MEHANRYIYLTLKNNSNESDQPTVLEPNNEGPAIDAPAGKQQSH